MPKDIECPHCGLQVTVDFEAFRPNPVYPKLNSRDARIYIEQGRCPSRKCLGLIVRTVAEAGEESSTVKCIIPPVNEVTFPGSLSPGILSQYKKAKKILPIDQNASAVMSRRCLQMLLREYFHIERGSLYCEMQELINKGKLPSYLAHDLDRVREIGNLGAHPEKSGMELPSEATDEEARWSLDILVDLFEHIAGREKSRLRNEQFDRNHPKKGEARPAPGQGT